MAGQDPGPRLDQGASQAAEALSRVARQLHAEGLLTTYGGNLSVLLLGSQRIVITPSGLPKGTLRPADMLVVNLDARPLNADLGGLQPSVEAPVHAAVYRTRPGARAVVHAHPPHATALATLGLAIEPVTVELAAYCRVPLLPYHPPGSPELVCGVSEAMRDADLVLLAGHGAFTAGTSLDEAAGKMAGLERACQTYLLIRQHAGGKRLPLVLPDKPELP